MHRGTLSIEAATAGAALMYLLDPVSGRRRRARLREKLSHAARAGAELLTAGGRDLANRTRGQLHQLRGQAAAPVSAERLEQRARARLGRFCSHPHAITVRASDGALEVSGPILRAEVEPLLRALRQVPGVSEVRSSLEPHDATGGVPALQGGVPRPGLRDAGARGYVPSARMLTTAAGTALLIRGLRSGGPLGVGAALAGAGLIARGATSTSGPHTLEGAARSIVINKAIEVDAPVETLFRVWQRLEDFPKITSHVEEVRLNPDGTYHWRVTGPGGVTVGWDAELTALETDRKIAWRSRAGSLIKSAGSVHFLPIEGGRCRIDIQLSYHPPGGAVGHALAKVLGADPKRQIDEDLVRLKSLVEDGKTRSRAGVVTLDQILGGAAPHPQG